MSREVISVMMVLVLVLLAILISNQFIHYLHTMAVGTTTMKTVLRVMTLQVPLLLGYLVPMGFFLGTVFVLGRWYADHEMTVMQACGLSPRMLLSMVLLIAVGVFLIEACLMLWVEPKAQWYRIRLLDNAAASLALAKMPVGYLDVYDVKRGIVVYADQKDSDKHRLQGVFITKPMPPDHEHAGEYRQMLTAKTMTESSYPTMGGNFLVLHNGYRYLVEPRDRNIQITHFKNFALTTMPNKPKTRPKDKIKFLSTHELWKRFSDPKAAAELHWRLAMPISIFILALLAVPLSYIKPRQGQYGSIFPALLVYVLYMNLDFMGTSWIRNEKLGKDLGLFWVHAIFLVAGLLLFLYRSRLLRWSRNKKAAS